MQITRIKPGGWVIIILLLAAIVFGVRSCAHLLAPREPARIAPPAQPVTVGNSVSGTPTPYRP